MTVYLDGVWLINGFVDYLLLAVSGNLTAAPIRRGRLILAGALGGIYGVLCLLPGWSFFGNLFWRCVMGGGMCLVAFGPGRTLMRQFGVLFLLTAAFSGIVLLLTELFSAPGSLMAGGVYYPVSMGTLVLTAGGAYGLISWALGRLRHHGGDIAAVEIDLRDHTKRITALRDTGNTLRDPFSGEMVMVTDAEVISSLLPELGTLHQEPQLLLEQIRRAAPELRPRLIPYKTVGVAHGLLVAVRPREVRISGKKERILLGISPAAVSDGGGYQALLGGAQP